MFFFFAFHISSIGKNYPGIKWGAENPDIELDVFCDPLCSDCATIWPQINDLLVQYKTLQVRFHTMPLSIHTWSYHSVKAVQALKLLAGEAKARDMLDALYNGDQIQFLNSRMMNTSEFEAVNKFCDYVSTKFDVDRDALKFVTDPNGEGRSVLPQSQQRLFRKIDLNAEDTYNVFAPTLRDASISNGLNIILTRIEDACGLSRGTLSQVDTITAKTATELKILKQRSYATNQDIQMALQEALEDAIYVMDVYSTLYEITPPGEYEASFEWDDSIIVDSESELSKRITLMQNKLASHLEIRMWYFGETENQARAALQQIDKEATQAMIQNAQASIMQANAGGGNAPVKEDEEEDTTKGPGDTTAAKKSTGQQADDLDNPNKNKANDGVKGQK